MTAPCIMTSSYIHYVIKCKWHHTDGYNFDDVIKTDSDNCMIIELLLSGESLFVNKYIKYESSSTFIDTCVKRDMRCCANVGFLNLNKYYRNWLVCMLYTLCYTIINHQLCRVSNTNCENDPGSWVKGVIKKIRVGWSAKLSINPGVINKGKTAPDDVLTTQPWYGFNVIA